MTERQSTTASGTAADNWGRWGEDDERGTLNLLTPATVLDAVRLCRTGRVYPLGITVGRDSQVPNVAYRPTPQRLTLNSRTDESMLVDFGGTPGTGSVEDVLLLGSHSGTHMDALSHIYTDDRIYNGFPAEAHTSLGGAPRCGIEKVGPIVTRGILVDVARDRGVERLAPGEVITAEDIEGAIRAQDTGLRAGDAVLVRTGWLRGFVDDGGSVPPEQPGIGLSAARLFGEADVALVGADNTAVEAMPFDGGEFVGGHVELLVRRGIHLLEHVWLEALAAADCHEFLFALAPLPLAGATASPVNPFAIA